MYADIANILPDKQRAACFTGHRPPMLAGCETDVLRLDLNEAIIDAIEAGYEFFYCGMAMGSDILAGELVIALREQYPWIHLIAAVPFPEQTRGWPQEWAERYHYLLRKADDCVVLMPSYRRDGYLVRDRYMVDRSSLLIGVYNGSARGGTAYTVRYARKKGLRIVLLHPKRYLKKR